MDVDVDGMSPDSSLLGVLLLFMLVFSVTVMAFGLKG